MADECGLSTRLTQAKVGQFDGHLLIDQQILRFKVSMNNQIGMTVGECLK